MSRNFFVAVLSVLATFASQASGAADPGVAARVEHRYVQGASDVLSRFVKPRDFNVTAEATVLSGKSIPAMKDAAIARLLMHLEPMRTARLLNLLQTENLDQYPRVTRQLSFIADAVLRSELDREILDGLRQAQGGQESNNRKFFVSYYKELLDNVGEDVGEQIVQQPVNDAMLRERVVANHITVNQFFGMEGELRARSSRASAARTWPPGSRRLPTANATSSSPPCRKSAARSSATTSARSPATKGCSGRRAARGRPCAGASSPR